VPRRARLACAAVVLGFASAVGSASVSAVVTPPPSGVGGEAVFWLAVSPSFATTGTVLAVTSPLQSCKQDCTHLWTTRDGGASWARAAATGWLGGRPVVAIDGGGHEVMLSGTDAGAQRSRDGGATWEAIGGGGTPNPAPSFAVDGTAAVAGQPDYVVSNHGSQNVGGSGDAYRDIFFMYAPGDPGSHPPVLLSAGDRSSGLPVIQQCDRSLTCHGTTTLPGASTFSIPVTLYPAADYRETGVVLAQSGRGIYKSIDAGASFQPLAIVSEQGASGTTTPMLAMDPGYREHGPDRTMYASVLQAFMSSDIKQAKNTHTSGGVFRSDDGGTTWRGISTGTALDTGSTAVAVAPGGRLFAGYLGSSGAGLLCSPDGRSWQALCAPPARAAAQAGSSKAAGGCAGAACAGAAAQGAVDPAANPAAGSSAESAGQAAAARLGAAHPAERSGGAPLLVLGAALVAVIAIAAGGFALLRRSRLRPEASAPG
jgi:photosystem II stability/assembly factor-like uncharacterized protein